MSEDTYPTAVVHLSPEEATRLRERLTETEARLAHLDEDARAARVQAARKRLAANRYPVLEVEQ